jgi:hypothetical protein
VTPTHGAGFVGAARARTPGRHAAARQERLGVPRRRGGWTERQCRGGGASRAVSAARPAGPDRAALPCSAFEREPAASRLRGRASARNRALGPRAHPSAEESAQASWCGRALAQAGSHRPVRVTPGAVCCLIAGSRPRKSGKSCNSVRAGPRQLQARAGACVPVGLARAPRRGGGPQLEDRERSRGGSGLPPSAPCRGARAARHRGWGELWPGEGEGPAVTGTLQSGRGAPPRLYCGPAPVRGPGAPPERATVQKPKRPGTSGGAPSWPC